MTASSWTHNEPAVEIVLLFYFLFVLQRKQTNEPIQLQPNVESLPSFKTRMSITWTADYCTSVGIYRFDRVYLNYHFIYFFILYFSFIN